MKKAVFLLLVSFAFAQAPAPSEPLKIHGVYMGQTVQDYLLNAPGKLRYAKLNVGDCSKASKRKNDFGSPSDRELCQQFATAMAGERTIVRLVYDLPGHVTFDHGTVVEFSDIFFPDHSNPLEAPSSPWGKVLYDLKAKLGEPVDTTPVVKENGFGAKFTYNAAAWSTPNLYVVAQETALNGNNLVKIVVVTESAKAAFDKEHDYGSKPSTLD